MEDRQAMLRLMIRQAHLARDGEEAEALARDVAGLLDNVDALSAIAVPAAPDPPPVDVSSLRPDDVTPSLPLGRALANCPATREPFVSVPKVIAAEKGDAS